MIKGHFNFYKSKTDLEMKYRVYFYGFHLGREPTPVGMDSACVIVMFLQQVIQQVSCSVIPVSENVMPYCHGA